MGGQGSVWGRARLLGKRGTWAEEGWWGPRRLEHGGEVAALGVGWGALESPGRPLKLLMSRHCSRPVKSILRGGIRAEIFFRSFPGTSASRKVE